MTNRRTRDLPRLSKRADEPLSERRRRSGLRKSLLGRAQRDREVLHELEALAEPGIVTHILDEVFASDRSVSEGELPLMNCVLVSHLVEFQRQRRKAAEHAEGR